MVERKSKKLKEPGHVSQTYPDSPQNKSLKKGLALLSIIAFQQSSFKAIKAMGNTIIHITVNLDTYRSKHI